MLFKLIEAYRQAVYGFIRRRMRPLTIEEAEEKKYFWAKIYAGTAWTCFGYMTYLAFKGEIKLPIREDLPKDIATAVALNKVEGVRFIKFRGFNKVEDLTYSKEEMKNLIESKPVSTHESDFKDSNTHMKS